MRPRLLLDPVRALRLRLGVHLSPRHTSKESRMNLTEILILAIPAALGLLLILGGVAHYEPPREIAAVVTQQWWTFIGHADIGPVVISDDGSETFTFNAAAGGGSVLIISTAGAPAPLVYERAHEPTLGSLGAKFEMTFKTVDFEQDVLDLVFGKEKS